MEDGKAVLRDKKEIKADSLQNPNDPDATYRAKNDQKLQGYVTNITEAVEEGKPNINHNPMGQQNWLAVFYIKAYQLRRQIESLPLEEQHKRNNVEAAMFQYSFHTRNGKT